MSTQLSCETKEDMAFSCLQNRFCQPERKLGRESKLCTMKQCLANSKSKQRKGRGRWHKTVVWDQISIMIQIGDILHLRPSFWFLMILVCWSDLIKIQSLQWALRIHVLALHLGIWIIEGSLYLDFKKTVGGKCKGASFLILCCKLYFPCDLH